MKNPFTDLEDDNIQLVDIRLLELEREFRSHPNGNPESNISHRIIALIF